MARRKDTKKKSTRKCKGELTEADLAEVVGGSRKRRRRILLDDEGDFDDRDITPDGAN